MTPGMAAYELAAQDFLADLAVDVSVDRASKPMIPASVVKANPHFPFFFYF